MNDEQISALEEVKDFAESDAVEIKKPVKISRRSPVWPEEQETINETEILFPIEEDVEPQESSTEKEPIDSTPKQQTVSIAQTQDEKELEEELELRSERRSSKQSRSIEMPEDDQEPDVVVQEPKPKTRPGSRIIVKEPSRVKSRPGSRIIVQEPSRVKSRPGSRIIVQEPVQARPRPGSRIMVQEPVQTRPGSRTIIIPKSRSRTETIGLSQPTEFVPIDPIGLAPVGLAPPTGNFFKVPSQPITVVQPISVTQPVAATNDLIYYTAEPKIKEPDFSSLPEEKETKTLSWRQKQLVQRSLSETKMYERALQISNAQLGFPLYPIYTNPRDRSVFMASKEGTDYFSHMLKSANMLGIEWKKDEVVTMNDKISQRWRLPAGNPFHILGFGPVIGTNRKRHPTRTLSVREITIQLNPDFFQIPRTMAKTTLQNAFADIYTRPVVSETVWRKFVSAASAKYSPTIVRQMIGSMINPKALTFMSIGQSDLKNNELVQILSSPGNMEIRQLYDELRSNLLSTSNPVYVGSFITALLGRAASLDWCPLFTKVFEIVNGRSTILSQDSRDIGIWQQTTISQMTKCYYRDVLIMHKELNAEILLANLFQVVFGLDWAQTHIGFIHGNLDARGALRYCPVQNDVYLFYNWRGKYYRVPSYGKVMKLSIPNMEKSSVYIEGTQYASTISAGAIDKKPSHKLPGSHLDLLRLGATLRVVLLDRTAKLNGPTKGTIKLLAKMLDNWSTCHNDQSKTGVGGSEVDALFLREKCIDETSEPGLCSWMSFVQIPKDLNCPKAIPSNQQKFFKMFEIPDVRQIPENALIYTIL